MRQRQPQLQQALALQARAMSSARLLRPTRLSIEVPRPSARPLHTGKGPWCQGTSAGGMRRAPCAPSPCPRVWCPAPQRTAAPICLRTTWIRCPCHAPPGAHLTMSSAQTMKSAASSGSQAPLLAACSVCKIVQRAVRATRRPPAHCRPRRARLLLSWRMRAPTSADQAAKSACLVRRLGHGHAAEESGLGVALRLGAC